MDQVSEANPAAEAIELSEADAQTLAMGAEEQQTPEPYTPPEEEPDELDKLVLPTEPEEGQPEELAEVEYEGKPYKLPPEIKDALLRQSDYTKKTMALAEERKAIEAKAAEIDTLRNLSGERMQALQETALIKAEIAKIENTPVHGLTDEQITRAEVRLNTLRSQLGQWEAFGQQAAQKEKEVRDQQFAKDRERALSEAARVIPNFDDARRSQLAEYISASGGDPEMINSITDPVVWKVLHDADIGRRFSERQRKAAQIKASQAAKTAPELGGKSTAAAGDDSNPAEMEKQLRAAGVI